MGTQSAAATAGIESRLLREGYGPGAWHGADMKAALDDVPVALAFWRPANGRHNIAEIALHHAYCARGVRAKLSGVDAEPFVLDGDDWFALTDEKTLSWTKVRNAVESQQHKLGDLIAGIDSGKLKSPLTEVERLDLVLGVTCHAVYHAGQIQLIKRLRKD